MASIACNIYLVIQIYNANQKEASLLENQLQQHFANINEFSYLLEFLHEDNNTNPQYLQLLNASSNRISITALSS